MKAQRHKKIKSMFLKLKIAGDFLEPCKIIVDGNFAKVCLDIGFSLHKFSTILNSKIKLFNTPCLLRELEIMGEDFQYVLNLLKNLDSYQCKHGKSPLTAFDCIKSLLENNNSRKLTIMSQDLLVHKLVLDIFPLPVIYFKQGNVLSILLPPQKYINKFENINNDMEDELTQENKKEIKKIKIDKIIIEKKINLKNLQKERNRLSLKIKKKALNPNPLSVKKRKI